MAIAFDAKSKKGFDASSTTLSHTCTGSNRLLVVAFTIDGSDTISGTPTYAGVNMTQLVTVAPGNFRIYLYYLIAPATGANNISVTLSGSVDAGIMATSYTGVAQTSPVDGTAAGANDNASPFGRAITTAVANSVVVFASADDDDTANARTPVASTNQRHDVLQGAGAGDYGGFMSDRITTTAGSYTMTYTNASVSASTTVIAAFKEAAGAITSNLTAALSFSGSLAQSFIWKKAITGALSFAGTLVGRNIFTKAVSGVLSFTGAISKFPRKSFTAVLNLTGGQTGYQTPALVQSVTYANGALAPQNMTANFPAAITAGNTIVVFAVTSGNKSLDSASDTNNSYTGLTFLQFTGVSTCRFFYKTNVTGGATAVTVSKSGSGNDKTIWIAQEWSGISSFESSQSQMQASTTAASTPNITNTAPNAVLIAGIGHKDTTAPPEPTLTPNSPWVNQLQEDNATGGPVANLISQVVNTSASRAASGTWTAAQETGSYILSFATATFTIPALKLTIFKKITAAVGYAGAFAKSAGKALSAGLSFVAGISFGGTFAYTQLLTGALGFVGNITKRTSSKQAGGVSFTGSLTKRLGRTISGTLSFVGNLVRAKTMYRALTGALSFAGNFSKRIGKQYTAGLSFVGSLSRLIRKGMTAGLSFVGAIIRAQKKTVTAILSFTGNVVNLTTKPHTGSLSFTGAFSLSNVFKKALTATLSFTGNMKRDISKRMTAGLGFTGNLLKRLAKTAFTGTLSFTGAIAKQARKSFPAGLSFSGFMVTSSVLFKNLTASLGFTGVFRKQANKRHNAGLSFTGAFTKSRNVFLTAVVGFTGIFSKAMSVKLFGNLSFSGFLSQYIVSHFVPIGAIISSFTNRGDQSSSTNIADVDTGVTISDVESRTREGSAGSHSSSGTVQSETNEQELKG